MVKGASRQDFTVILPLRRLKCTSSIVPVVTSIRQISDLTPVTIGSYLDVPGSSEEFWQCAYSGSLS